MTADHLNLDSDIRCHDIPVDEIANVLTAEQKKKWTSAAIKECKKVSHDKDTFKIFYAGPATMTTDELLDMLGNLANPIRANFMWTLRLKKW